MFSFVFVKKATALFLAIYYTIISIGITANIHYCGGHFNNLELVSLAQKHTNCCGEKPMKMDCCKDKKIVVKKSLQDIPTPKVCIHSHSVIDLITPIIFYSPKTTLPFSDKIVLATNHSPPLDVKHPIYLRHRSFLI